VAGALLNNWKLGGIVNASTGAPFSVIIAGDPMGLNGVDVIGWPDLVKSPGCATLTNPNDHLHYIKTQCFTAPDPLTRLGNAGRNIARAPGLLSVDAAVYKNVPIEALGKGGRAQVRVECFNMLNRANFAAPLSNNAVFNQSGGAIASAGRITSTQTTARQVQIGLRLNW
jgi:hypothetical protein